MLSCHADSLDGPGEREKRCESGWAERAKASENREWAFSNVWHVSFDLCNKHVHKSLTEKLMKISEKKSDWLLGCWLFIVGIASFLFVYSAHFHANGPEISDRMQSEQMKEAAAQTGEKIVSRR